MLRTGSTLRSPKSPMKPPMRLRRQAQGKKLTEPGRVLPQNNALHRLDAAAATQLTLK